MKHVTRSLAIATLVTASIAGTALAQQRSARDMMNDMRAKHGKTFADCQSLAISRGYNLSDNEFESRAVAMFVEGCIMGKQS
jgi:hypothetical protein